MNERLNNIRIPQAILSELKPAIKPIIEQLCKLKDGYDINKEEAVKIIDASADDFNEFFNNQFDVFGIAVNQNVDATTTIDELDHLYKNAEAATLFKQIDQFVIFMKRELDRYRRNKKILKMFEAWKSITETESPAEWSKINSLPILCLFTEEAMLAQSVFSALNKSTNLPSESEIDKAISFIKSKAMNILKDKNKCEKMFIEFFCGDYSYVVENADSLRDKLRSILHMQPYEWYYQKENVKHDIVLFAKECYELKYRTQVKDKVRKLSAQEAQKFLDELVESDPLLGISILKG